MAAFVLPFDSHYLSISEKIRLHYFDEGSGSAVLMLHGNPTWSYMYRNVIGALSPFHRCIALDFPGCGLSSKPQDWPYSLASHESVLDAFVNAILPAGEFDLVLHDWGGPVGLLWAERHPERIRHIVLMNTVGWTTREVPKAIYLTKCPILGAFLVRVLNVLQYVALKRVPVHPLSLEVLAAYRYPYPDYRSRIAIQRFPQDIPLTERHPSYGTFRFLEEHLDVLRGKHVLFAWGKQDFCFPMRFLERWKRYLPDATYRVFENASHFLLEDAPGEVIPEIEAFLNGTK